MGMWKIFVQRVFFIGYVLLLQHGMMKKKRKNSFLGKNEAGECLLPLKWGNDYQLWCIAILVVCVSRSIFWGEWIECTILQFFPPKRNKKIYSRLVCRTIDSNYDIIIVFLSSGPLFIWFGCNGKTGNGENCFYKWGHLHICLSDIFSMAMNLFINYNCWWARGGVFRGYYKAIFIRKLVFE